MRVSLRLHALITCVLIDGASGFGTPTGSCAKMSSKYQLRPEVARQRNSASSYGPGEANLAPLTAIEFYSGIGGLRVALNSAVGVTDSRGGNAGATVISSFDINTVANMVRSDLVGD